MKKIIHIFLMLLVGLLASPLAHGQARPFSSGWKFSTINGNPTQWQAYTELRSKVPDAFPKGTTFFFDGEPTKEQVNRLVFPYSGSTTLAGQFYTTFISTPENKLSKTIPFIVNYGYYDQEDDRRFHFQRVTVAFGDYKADNEKGEFESPEKDLSSRDISYDCNIVEQNCRVYQTHSFEFDRTAVWPNENHSFAKCIIIRYYMDNKVAKTLILPVLILGNFEKYVSTGPGPIELYTILRAMPGDQSSTFLEKNETISSEVTMGVSESNSNSTTVTAKASTGFSAGPIKIGASVEASKSTTNTKVQGKENAYSINFTTSSRIVNDNSKDDFSDMFVAERRTYQYGLSYSLDATTNNATNYVFVKAASKMTFYPIEPVKEMYYTEKSLLREIIPDLEKEKRFGDVKFWKELIQKNNELKAQAKKGTPVTTDAKISGREQSVSTEKTNSITLSQEVSIEKTQSLKVTGTAGIEGIVDTEVSGEKKWTFTSTTSSSNTNGKGNVVTTGYHLDDDDFTFGDRFKIRRWEDPVMGTPVWELDPSSVTSLPYEGGISSDQPAFFALDPVTGEEVKSAKISDIPAGEEVTFDVIMRNNYEGERGYNFRFNPSLGNDPDYRLAGGSTGAQTSLSFKIPGGGFVKKQIRIKNPDPKTPLPFENMMFIMQPERTNIDYWNSDGYVSDTIFLSAFYGGTDSSRVPNNNFVSGAILLPTDGSVQSSYIGLVGLDEIEFPITNKNATSTDQEQVLVPSNWEPEVDGKPVIDNSVWFKVIATSPRILINMKHAKNEGFKFQLAAYKTSNIGNTNSYTLLSSADRTTSLELNNQTLGDTIYILVDGFKGAQSSFSISVSALAPVNDDACKSILLTKADGNIITGFTNVAATVEDKEQFLIPESKDPIKGWVDGDIKHSVWFRFVAPPTGEAIIEVLNATFDSQIAAFDVGRVCGPTYFSQYTHMAANDALTLSGGLDSKVTLKGLTPGQPYGFMVDGFEGETGNFDIRISAPLPPNDKPENAIELVIDAAGQGVFTNIGSTSSKEEQVISPPTVALNKPDGWADTEEDGKHIQHSIWFKFKAPAEGAVQISTCNQATFHAQLALYKIGDLTNYSTYEYLGADDGGHLCRIPPNNEYPNGTSKRGSIINATGLEDGETYYLLVDGQGNDVGQFSIDLLTEKITTPPVNDAPCDAIELPVNGQVQTGYQNFAATKDKSKTGYKLTPSEWLDNEMGGTV